MLCQMGSDQLLLNTHTLKKGLVTYISGMSIRALMHHNGTLCLEMALLRSSASTCLLSDTVFTMTC